MITLPNPINITPAWIAGVPGIEALGQAVPVRFTRAEKRALRKRGFLRPSVWAERHRVLPATARFSGYWRNSNFPYIAGILDASFARCVQEIVICAAPQTGKTEAVYTCIGYAADRRPGNVMINFPTETDAKDNAKDRLKKMFEDSPRLREYLTGYADDLGALKLTLQHMIIYMAWANSPGRLSNRPAMYLFGDEVDKYPAAASKKEASPVDLLRKRQRTYEGLGKLWLTSSPTIESGPIWVALTKECHVVFDFFARCPACGGWQKIEFGDRDTPHGIKWPAGYTYLDIEKNPACVYYQCAKCDTKWDDGARDLAVRAGEWRERERGLNLDAAIKYFKPMRVGFHLPAWPSPLVPLYKCAAAFVKAIPPSGPRDINALKDFRNGFAAEPWEIIEQAREEDSILRLKDDRPAGIVPAGGRVSCLLAAVDTQDAGFWYEVRAFGYGMTFDSWGVRSGFVTSFEALARVLWEDVYKDADGNHYPVQFVVQDAMGHRTAEVYTFCQRNRGRILPSQGRDTMPQPHAYTNIEYFPGTKKPIPGGLQLLRVNSNYYKNQLSSMLTVNPGDPGCWYFNSEMTDEWARQMTAEGINPDNGRWENPKNRANHAWDVSYLLLAAADIVGVKLKEKPALKKQENKQAHQQEHAGGWVNAGSGWLKRMRE